MVASSDSLWGRVLDTGSVTPILTPAFAGGRLFPRRGGRGFLRMPALPSPQPSPWGRGGFELVAASWFSGFLLSRG